MPFESFLRLGRKKKRVHHRKKTAHHRKAKPVRMKRMRHSAHGYVLKAEPRLMHGRTSKRRDRKLKAMKPGKRLSRTGGTYWETRRNRSDKRKYL